MSLDYQLFQFINSFAGIFSLLDFMMVAITDFGVPLLAIIALSVCKKKNLYKMLFAVWLVFIVDFFVKLLFFRPRPFVSHEVNLLVDHLKTASFPSRHTDLAFVFAQSVFFVDKKTGFLAFAVALLVGFSRIFVGVHYPFDVLAGVFFGIAGAFAAFRIIDYFWKRD
ncbi:phosphatase PAP2 family protein [Candidatus Woesearchaeota archaeon]|nr:phosphatase PAP2 family protein [Candidatus Woesearchaeota archaeon]